MSELPKSLGNLNINSLLRYFAAGFIAIFAWDPSAILSPSVAGASLGSLATLAFCIGMVLHGVHRAVLLPFAHMLFGVHLGAKEQILSAFGEEETTTNDPLLPRLLGAGVGIVGLVLLLTGCSFVSATLFIALVASLFIINSVRGQPAREASWFLQAFMLKLNTQTWGERMRQYVRTWNSFTHALYLSAWSCLSGFLAHLPEVRAQLGIGAGKSTLASPAQWLLGEASATAPMTALAAGMLLLGSALWTDYKLRFVLACAVDAIGSEERETGGKKTYRSAKYVRLALQKELECAVKRLRLSK
jgi:hypothetical protein